MLNKFLKLTITLFFTFAINFSANAEIKVVASIKPIHSLASYLMDGVGKPDLIVDGYNSPHGFALKPSHAKMLQNADLVFWVGEDLEAFLEKPLKSLAKKAEKIELMEIKGLKKLEFRERNIFEDHDDHKEKHKDNEKEIHAEFIAHYHFHCDNPKKLNGAKLGFFKTFPSAHELEVKWITPRGQGAAELTAKSPNFTFKK